MAPSSSPPRALVSLLLGLLLAPGARDAGAGFDLPRPTGFVVDQAGIIDGSTKRQLEALNAELRTKTGAEIAIVTVRSTQPETAFDYAMAIAESWKPGARNKDNGIVFLVATEDREMYILTGYGAEGALPDGRVGEIRDTIVKPAFQRGDFSGGILNATATMAALLAAEQGVKLTGVPEPRPPERAVPRGGGLALPILVILIMLAMGLARRFHAGARGLRRRRGSALDDILLGGLLGGGGRSGGFGGSGGFGDGGFGGFGGGGFGGGGAGGRW